MKVLSRSNAHAYMFSKSMQWTHLDPIDQAIHWNTCRKLVELTLSVDRSREMSAIKTIVVIGKS